MVQVCRSGGFSGAARALKLTQPALSKSIARLEAQLGVRLFERTGGAAKPTELGRLVAERGKALLGSADALANELEQLAGGSTGRLRIGVGPATRLKPLPDVIRGILERFPALQINARQDDGLAIMRGVDQGRYDVVFGYYENAEPYGELMRVKIFEDQQTAVVRPDHPLLGASEPLRPSQLLRHRMASVGMTPAFKRWTGQLTPAEMRNASAFVSEDFELLRLAAESFGHVARGPRFLFREAIDAGSLVELPVTWVSTYECWMLTTQTLWQSPLIKAIAEIARAASSDGVARRREVQAHTPPLIDVA